MLVSNKKCSLYVVLNPNSARREEGQEDVLKVMASQANSTLYTPTQVSTQLKNRLPGGFFNEHCRSGHTLLTDSIYLALPDNVIEALLSIHDVQNSINDVVPSRVVMFHLSNSFSTTQSLCMR